jgi:NitT/TauT family transport system ATP-binding protein
MDAVTTPLIAVDRIKKRFRSTEGAAVQALSETSLTVDQGAFVSVVGPSGCGKTTLLRIIAGLVPIDTGTVRLGGREVKGPTPDVGIVFQDANLFPWRNVLENVLLPAQVLRRDLKTAKDRARALIAMVGLSGFENKYPHELSGGMRQRVAIARALLHDPPLLLLDEPFGALDAMTRDQMNLELLEIWRRSGKTVLLITHSIPEAVFLSDHVFVMSARPGQIVDDISIDFERPRRLDVMGDPRFGEYLIHVRRRLGGDGMIH